MARRKKTGLGIAGLVVTAGAGLFSAGCPGLEGKVSVDTLITRQSTQEELQRVFPLDGQKDVRTTGENNPYRLYTGYMHQGGNITLFPCPRYAIIRNEKTGELIDVGKEIEDKYGMRCNSLTIAGPANDEYFITKNTIVHSEEYYFIHAKDGEPYKFGEDGSIKPGSFKWGDGANVAEYEWLDSKGHIVAGSYSPEKDKK